MSDVQTPQEIEENKPEVSPKTFTQEELDNIIKRRVGQISSERDNLASTNQDLNNQLAQLQQPQAAPELQNAGVAPQNAINNQNQDTPESGNINTGLSRQDLDEALAQQAQQQAQQVEQQQFEQQKNTALSKLAQMEEADPEFSKAIQDNPPREVPLYNILNSFDEKKSKHILLELATKESERNRLDAAIMRFQNGEDPKAYDKWLQGHMGTSAPEPSNTDDTPNLEKGHTNTPEADSSYEDYVMSSLG